MAEVFKKYDSYVVDNDMAARMRLKSATTSVPRFGQVRLINSLEEALASLKNAAAGIDVIFISRRFAQDAITAFIAEAKHITAGQDAAYVLVLRTDDQQADSVAKNVLGGTDGFLLEPYSVDQLVEITELAARVRKERSQEREAAALRFLINDVIKQIDRVWFLKSSGFDVGRSLKKLKDMCKVFDSLDNETRELYFEIVVNAFETVPVPQPPSKQYKGVSERVRLRMEKKILADIEAEESEAKGATKAKTDKTT